MDVDVQALQAAAEAADGARCTEGEAVFWLPAPRSLAPGHIYSDAGRDEFKISGSCEYHFDGWTMPCLECQHGYHSHADDATVGCEEPGCGCTWIRAEIEGEY